MEKYEANAIQYLYKRSSDGKYAWITKVQISEDYKSNQLEFPEEIKGSLLVCIGYEATKMGESKSDVTYNVFKSLFILFPLLQLSCLYTQKLIFSYSKQAGKYLSASKHCTFCWFLPLEYSVAHNIDASQQMSS